VTRGIHWHVTYSEYGWRLESKEMDEILKSQVLVLLLRVGQIPLFTFSDVPPKGFGEVPIPYTGTPSERNGEVFSCRTWVMDTLDTMSKADGVFLGKDVGRFL
jgi:hypothetical protein